MRAKRGNLPINADSCSRNLGESVGDPYLRSVAFGRNQNVFEPRIALMTRIGPARLPLSIRVIRVIRCFHVLPYGGPTSSSLKVLAKKTRCYAFAVQGQVCLWRMISRTSRKGNRERREPRQRRRPASATAGRVGCAHRLVTPRENGKCAGLTL